MNKNKKIIIIAIVVVIVSVLAYFIFFKDKSALPDDSLIGKIPIHPDYAPASTVIEEQYPIQVGSHGDKTRLLQAALNVIGGNAKKITEDGVFGNDTKIKLITTVPTSMYGFGATVNESQLFDISSKANNL
jgi:hypothetical protein